MARLHPDAIPEDFADLAPDIIDFGDVSAYDDEDKVYFPEDVDLTGILPDLLLCAKSTVVTQHPVSRAAPARDATRPRDLPAGLDDFDFT